MRNVEISREVYNMLVDFFHKETGRKKATYGELDEFFTPHLDKAIIEYLAKHDEGKNNQ